MIAFYENKTRDLFFGYKSQLNFPAHLHRHFELVYMLEGQTTTYVDGNKEILNKGDIFISFPNQIHQYISEGPERYLILIFSPDIIKDMNLVIKNYIPKSQIIKDVNSNKRLFPYLTAVVEAYESDYEFKDMQIKGHLLIFFSELLKTIELAPIKESNLSMLQHILNYCMENYASDLSLEAISKSLHISKYYISHLLKRKIKIGFSDYINSLRISEACRYLLNEEKTITEIAYLVGFNTARTFNRAFIKHIGITPTRFKKNSLNDMMEK